MSITWVDNVTPLDAVNMNKLEQTARKNAASGYVGLDGSQFATVQGRIIAKEPNVCFLANPAAATAAGFMLAVGSEAQPRWDIFGDGKMYWGAGGSTTVDTNLYRVAANIL